MYRCRFIVPILVVVLCCSQLLAYGDDVLVSDSPQYSPESSARNLQSGSITNSSNAEIYAFCSNASGTETTLEVMPGQVVDIAADTTQVRLELVDDSFGDEEISVDVIMPDGSEHPIRSFPATIRI